MMTLLPSTSDGTVTQKYFHLPDYVCAPIQQGDVVGTVELKLAGETIGVVELIAGQDVARNPLLFGVDKVKEFLTSLVPEGGAGAQPDCRPDLWAVAAVRQLEPPQAHQKDPPPLLSKAKALHRMQGFCCIVAPQARFFRSSVRLWKVWPWLPVTVSAWSRLLRTLSSTHSATARNKGLMASSWSRVMGSRAFSE